MRVLLSETEMVCRAFREAFADNIIEVLKDGPCVQRAYRMTWDFYLDHGFVLLKRALGDRKFFVRCEPEVREETYVPITEGMNWHTEFTERVILFRLAFPWKGEQHSENV